VREEISSLLCDCSNVTNCGRMYASTTVRCMATNVTLGCSSCRPPDVVTVEGWTALYVVAIDVDIQVSMSAFDSDRACRMRQGGLVWSAAFANVEAMTAIFSGLAWGEVCFGRHSRRLH